MGKGREMEEHDGYSRRKSGNFLLAVSLGNWVTYWL
jgi:hypothetical protein